jgi:conjugative transfer region protein TrbK
MRVDAALVKRVTRAGAVAVLGIAILATAVNINTSRRMASPPAPAAAVANPLDAELARCRAIAHPEDVDDACRAAWAEVRRRFFAPTMR